MPKIFLNQLKENEPFESDFLVLKKALLSSKTGRPYLSLTVSDKSGEIEARVWENAELIGSGFERHDFVRLSGRPIMYQERMQLNVSKIERLSADQVEPRDFLPMSKKNIENMFQALCGFVEKEVQNRWIKIFLKSILEDFSIAKQFKKAPAAKTNHHAWIGGLLEHVLHLCEVGKDILKHYPMISADLVYTGLILHDIGKIEELCYERFFGYTDEGQLVGHLIQGVELVYDKIRAIPGFPKKLKTHIVHLILAHHGRLEFGSPKLPMTLEALMVHYLDDLDSKIQGVLDLAEKENGGDSAWVSFNRLFGRPMYRATLKDLEESLLEEIDPKASNQKNLSSRPESKKPAFSKGPLTVSLGDALQKILR